MHTDEFEKAFSDFLEGHNYDQAEDTLSVLSGPHLLQAGRPDSLVQTRKRPADKPPAFPF